MEFEKNKSVVCVIGMHRSGTSLISGILNLCGVNFGDEKKLLFNGLDNEKGHWENVDVMSINEKILNIFGGSWDNPPSFPDNWENDKSLFYLYEELDQIKENFSGVVCGFKDPRTSITLPFWKKVFPNMKYIISVRDPREVASSLFKRDGIQVRDGIVLWLIYFQQILLNTENSNRIFVNYQSVLDGGVAEIKKIVSFIDHRDVSIENRTQELNNFISLDLQHNKSDKNNKLNSLNFSSNKEKIILEIFIDALLKEGEAPKLDKKFYIQEENIKKKDAEIKKMKSSKFWKMRCKYMKLKKKLFLC